MMPIEPRRFAQLAQFHALSQPSLSEHLRLYEGYVAKFNALSRKLQSLQHAGHVYAGADSESVKVDLTYALGAIKNHELFFDILGPDSAAGPLTAGPLEKAIDDAFHGMAQYLADLRQTALLGRGWAWTAFDLDRGTLFNYAGARNGIPVWNTVPILGIDLYGHAYFYDFGTNKPGYVDAIIKSFNWGRITERYLAARSLAEAVK